MNITNKQAQISSDTDDSDESGSESGQYYNGISDGLNQWHQELGICLQLAQNIW